LHEKVLWINYKRRILRKILSDNYSNLSKMLSTTLYNFYYFSIIKSNSFSKFSIFSLELMLILYVARKKYIAKESNEYT